MLKSADKDSKAPAQNQQSLKPMSLKLFKEFSDFIYEKCGINLTASKKTLLEARLQKRLRLLNLNTYEQYKDYLFSAKGMDNELVEMIDVVTTNKTDFFREPAHFEYLVNTALPTLMRERGTSSMRIRCWSAGCSTGEEPYTLAMVLNDYAEQHRGIQFSILASDISTKVLQTAIRAVYDMSKVEPVPFDMKKKYLLRHKDPRKQVVRILPQLRNLIDFRRLNFKQTDYGIKDPLDVIFCRNVIIYFDRQTQEKLMYRFCQHLRKGGYIFLGHSETLNGMTLPLTSVAPTIYRTTR